MAAEGALLTVVGEGLVQMLLGLPLEVRRGLAEHLLADTEATAGDTHRLAEEAAARDAAWGRAAPTGEPAPTLPSSEPDAPAPPILPLGP